MVIEMCKRPGGNPAGRFFVLIMWVQVRVWGQKTGLG